MNRRDFLATSAAGAALAVHAAEPAAKPLRVGLIGCGWYGKCDLFRLLQVAPVEVVALCDVDRRMLADAEKVIGERKGFSKKPRLHGDYRDLLKERDCDVVIVGTPDHWHALPAIAAMKSGADIWVQKPISVDVMEGKVMLDTARSLGRVVQVGMQRRSTPHLIEARDRVIAAGKLGKVGLVETCCYYHMRANDAPPVVKVPDFFDYEMWTGPAPLRPYDAPKNAKYGNEHLPHRRWWRAFMEYGNGITGDMCVHMLDMVRWMLDLGWPATVGATGGVLVQKAARSNVADTQAATFDFGDTKVLWQHRTYGNAADPEYPWAAIFYGDKGTLKASVNKYEFTPTGAKKPELSGTPVFEYDKHPEDKTEPDLEQHVASALRGHWRDFLARRADRGRPVSDIEEGHISTASCILANLSMQLKRSLAWDAARHEVVGDAEATKLLKRDYRSPWTHPAAG
jgi:predicted dehydrogenase